MAVMKINRLFYGLGLLTLSATAQALDPTALATLGQPIDSYLGSPTSVDANGFYLRSINDEQFLFTADGRLAFSVKEGFDLWSNKTIPATEFKNINRIKFGEIDLGEVTFDHLVIGKGQHVVYGVIDPYCGYCKELIKEAKHITDKGADITFKFAIVPIAGEESEDVAKKLSCMSGEGLYWTLVDQAYANLPPADDSAACVKKQMMSAVVIRTALDIQATPVMFAPNGEKIQGLPKDLKAKIEENLK